MIIDHDTIARGIAAYHDTGADHSIDRSVAAAVFAAIAQVDVDTVTPIMIDAGIEAYKDDRRRDISPRLVTAIYLAMTAAQSDS